MPHTCNTVTPVILHGHKITPVRQRGHPFQRGPGTALQLSPHVAHPMLMGCNRSPPWQLGSMAFVAHLPGAQLHAANRNPALCAPLRPPQETAQPHSSALRTSLSVGNFWKLDVIAFPLVSTPTTPHPI